MFKIISGILFIVIFHIITFVLFPDTGRYGNYYLYGLIGLWIFLYLYMITSRFYNFLSFTPLLKVIFFIIMMFSSFFIIPQEDKQPILYKLIHKKFPNSEQIKRGKIKYLNNIIKFEINRTINPIINELEKNTNKIVKEMVN
ncbi:MAG: hypothetical protein N2Z20_03655 [Elusimicrobiales bacterium]|nr:hypothetical protein [Elusimicrobiales bacterium]